MLVVWNSLQECLSEQSQNDKSLVARKPLALFRVQEDVYFLTFKSFKRYCVDFQITGHYEEYSGSLLSTDLKIWKYFLNDPKNGKALIKRNTEIVEKRFIFPAFAASLGSFAKIFATYCWTLWGASPRLTKQPSLLSLSHFRIPCCSFQHGLFSIRSRPTLSTFPLSLSRSLYFKADMNLKTRRWAVQGDLTS